MIPIYNYMDSHPFQKNQTPFNPYQYPNMESIPSYMMMDPTKSRNYWHYGYPMAPYSCCNGGNFFTDYYNFRPPHQHIHCYGGYPPCPEPWHVQYVPPTHYNVEQPRYEFDKNMMRNHHCCGCPNSLCGRNLREDKCVKIEEEKPENQRKGPLVPLKSNQSPIVWIPPDYIKSEKEREPSETRTMKEEKEPHGSNLKSVQQAPKFWNGWPLPDLSHLGSWLPDAERMGAQSAQNNQQEVRKKEFPFPLIWMPSFSREESAKKDVQNMDVPRKYTEEPSNVGKLVPKNILQKDGATSEGPEIVKTINQNNTPEMVNLKTEDTMINKERRCIPVETAKDNEEKELSRNNVKGKSSSSPNKSRLPPVCLRVDPFPKKKNGNGSPRSQSSPKSTAVKESSRPDSKINNVVVEPGTEKIIKAIEVKTHESPDGKQGDKEDISNTGEPLSSPMQPQPQEKFFDEICKEGTGESTSEEYREKERTISHVSNEKAVDEGLEVSSGDLVQEEGKKEKTNLSDVEAAVLIQSAYRGYEARRWELLKKMKQLAEVRQEVIEVQNRVKALESDPKDEKERMFVGEMIMRLLLKLDTIQGLNPSVREFRKSLAKELVTLQEKLDYIMINKPAELVPKATMPKSTEHFDMETQDAIKEEEQHEDDVVAIGEIFPKEANEINCLLGESHGSQPLCGVDHTVGFEGVKFPTDEELQDEDTCEMFSQNFSNRIEGEKDMSLLMEDKKPDETESGAEMNNAEEMVGEVLQTDVKEETVDYRAYSLEDGQHRTGDSLEVYVSNPIPDDQVGAQEGQASGVLDKITISAPDENAQTEDQLAADMELPTREGENPNNFKADKLEHIEMRGEVSEAEENAHHLAVGLSSDKTSNEKQPEGQEECRALNVGLEQNGECLSYRKCENDNEGAFDGSAGVPGDFRNELVSKRNEQRTAVEVEKMLEDKQHQPKPSSELDDQARRACDESAELLEELSKSSRMITEKNEEQIAEESKMAEDMLQGPCFLDPVPSNNLHNQANELHAAGEATSTEMGVESLLVSPNASRETMSKHDLGSEREMDKKLVENEKMREMVEKLMEAGKEQIAIISKLRGRVKELEKRLTRKKKLRRGCGKSMSKHPTMNGRMNA